MTALVILLVRILLLIFVIRFIASLFSKKQPQVKKGSRQNIKRYAAKTNSIEDADFDEVE